MARFFCKCGTLVQNFPGGVRVNLDEELAASQMDCPSCSDTCWTLAAGMQFVDAGLTYETPGDYEQPADVGIANTIGCTCGVCVVGRNGVIDFDVVAVEDVAEESATVCCGCGVGVVVVPAGYRLRFSIEGKTVCKFPQPVPGHSDWKWPGTE